MAGLMMGRVVRASFGVAFLAGCGLGDAIPGQDTISAGGSIPASMTSVSGPTSGAGSGMGGAGNHGAGATGTGGAGGGAPAVPS